MRLCAKKIILILIVGIMTFTSFSLYACSSSEEPTDDVKVDTNKVAPDFSEEKFFITYCDRPPTPTTEHLQRYKDAGFNYYLMTEDDYPFTDAEGNITEKYLGGLQACKDLGLNVLIRNYYGDPGYFSNENGVEKTYQTVTGSYTYKIPKRNITNQLTNLDVVKGYYMTDEPSYTEIDNFANIIDWYNNYGGETLFHVNLNSSYGASLFPGHTWEEYLDKYIDVILKNVNGPKTLSIDYYPMRKDNRTLKNYIRKEFLYNLITVAEKTKAFNSSVVEDKNKVITCFCIEAYNESNDDVREIMSAAEVSFQINLSIAFGAKNLEYYMYRGMDDSTSMVDAQTQLPRDLYYYVKEANEELAKIKNIILAFDYVGAKAYKGSQVSDSTNSTAIDMMAPLSLNDFSIIKDVTARVDTVITEMKDKNNNKGYMICNYSEPTLGMVDNVKITLRGAKKAFVFIDGESKIVDVTNNNLYLNIKAGKAAFVYPICN